MVVIIYIPSSQDLMYLELFNYIESEHGIQKRRLIIYNYFYELELI